MGQMGEYDEFFYIEDGIGTMFLDHYQDRKQESPKLNEGRRSFLYTDRKDQGSGEPQSLAFY
jgi:hypothetical protein